jgi:diguanylate cyclase (GGDEF)-like protein
MQALSFNTGLKPFVRPRDWLWWQLPPLMRLYVATPPAGAAAAIAALAWHTSWRADDLEKFILLLICGTISVVSTPRIMYGGGGLNRDFSSIWVLPTAILLPPIYAALMPIPLLVAMKLFVHRGVLHRTVFTIAATSLGYAAASFVFRWIPVSIAGAHVGPGARAFTWALAVAACEIIGSTIHRLLILAAVKLSDPGVRITKMEWNREALQGIFVEIDLGVLITMAVALSPALVLLAVPTVLLVRRFLVHPLLVAQSRVDPKTGLLNFSTWEQEAEGELSRSVRTGSAMAIALVDIDHFKAVNDTYGHLVGDKVLKALADALTGQLRDYDRAGRFGGEEFVLLLAQATESDARRIAQRLRKYVGNMSVPVSDRPSATRVTVTISIGVTAMEAGRSRELTDMLAAADFALYRAKQAGRNRVSVTRSGLNTKLRAGLSGTAVGPVAGPVGADPAGASLVSSNVTLGACQATT